MCAPSTTPSAILPVISYKIPNVTIVNDEARSYLTRTDRRFDIIQVSLIDTWAATAAGAFVLSESSLYTREAWDIFLGKLRPTAC